MPQIISATAKVRFQADNATPFLTELRLALRSGGSVRSRHFGRYCAFQFSGLQQSRQLMG